MDKPKISDTISAVTAIGGLVTAVVALLLTIEARSEDEAKIDVRFDPQPVALVGPENSTEPAPEKLETSFSAINLGKRSSAVVEMTCWVTANGHRTELINASAVIYRIKETRPPIPVPYDSVQHTNVQWILGRDGPWRPYNGRFSLLPADVEYQLSIQFLTGENVSKNYAKNDLKTLSLELAQQYEEALSPVPSVSPSRN